MGEDNIVKIIVALIALSGTILGIIVGYITKSKKQVIIDAKREQKQNDLFDRLFREMEGIKKRLDIHNKYADKLGEIERSMVSIKKDIEYLRKERHEKENN